MPKLFFALLLLPALVQTPDLRAQPLQEPAATSSSATLSGIRASPAAAPTILDGYIHLGLDSNLALHQRNFDWQRAQLDLKRARTLFYPQLDFNSQYTAANGGRSQSIPVGDLLNNVYSTLNQLTGTNKFPQVANQNIQFLPNDYHDTKMEISLPLFNMDLQHNKQVNGELINTRRADADIYRRDLVQHIRQAYYQYLQAGKAVDIYANALGLVKENRRVSEKMVANRMATKEIVLRAQAQVSQVESSLIEAKNNLRNAAAYFNFLLNRPLGTPVLVDPALTTDPALTGAPGSASDSAAGSTTSSGAPPSAVTSISGSAPRNFYTELPAGREELEKLRSVQRILESNLRWNKAYLYPKLSTFYDIGFQGYGFKFNSSQFYQLAGVQLLWPLFRGGDNKYKIRQTSIDIASTQDQYKELTQQLTLQVQTASNDYSSAVETLQSLSDEVNSARETYRLAERRFNEGQALQIELVDARTQMTGAEIRYSLGRLTVLNRAADLERVTASYKF